MGGRTKKVAQTIVDALPQYDIAYLPFEFSGNLSEKLKIVEKFNNRDFSMMEDTLNSLDSEKYDIIFIGMPTYGNLPPKVFDEILERMKDIKDKKIIIFSTARFTGEGTVEYMKSKIEAKGAKVIYTQNFRGFFKISTKKVKHFAKKIRF